MKAREFLAQKKIEPTVRNLIKEPLTAAEIAELAKTVGDAQELVAPKRRAEAEGLKGKALIDWLAADGGRLRRPIVVKNGKVTLGFAADARDALEKLL
jgi:arsenate reductase-like glutaredoxin family protein